jgi:hypothetical protein
MYTISFEPQPMIRRMNIHNQCSDFKLTNQRSFVNFMNWKKYIDNEVDTGSMTNAVLISSWAAFEGGLTYQLQRKSVKSDNQLESTYTLLFITWKSEGYKELRARVHLIECDKRIEWNQYKLEEYRQRHHSQLNTYTGPIKDTWLIHDGTVLVTRLELNLTQRNGVLNITISEGIKDKHTKRPEWISPEV